MVLRTRGFHTFCGLQWLQGMVAQDLAPSHMGTLALHPFLHRSFTTFFSETFLLRQHFGTVSINHNPTFNWMSPYLMPR